MFKSFSKAFMLYKQLMSLTEKTINTIVYHFNYNAICHKTAIRQICHIKSQIACITFISNKLKALFFDSYVVHAQFYNHFPSNLAEILTILKYLYHLLSLTVHPVRF